MHPFLFGYGRLSPCFVGLPLARTYRAIVCLCFTLVYTCLVFGYGLMYFNCYFFLVFIFICVIFLLLRCCSIIGVYDYGYCCY